MMKVLYVAVLLSFGLCATSCDSKTSTNSSSTEAAVTKGTFSGDSALQFIKDQLAFGPRVPGSDAHNECADYIVAKLKEYDADTVIEQLGTVMLFNNDVVPMRNILGRYNTDKSKRILLVAHYDTRPWADQEPNEADRLKPIPGANDGASGVAVLLEMARNFAMKKPDVAVDLLFVDLEDSGNTGGFGNNNDTWGLGTQAWVKGNRYRTNGEVMPSYGILFDMVGGKNARFHREYFSQKHARSVTDRIWSEAAALKLDDIFVDEVGNFAVVDDHIFLTNGGIPTCDIIESVHPETETFPPYWHTQQDDISNISKNTLLAVGKTALNVIYNEKSN